LVDDDPMMAVIMSKILREEGCVVASVEDGIAALKFLGIEPSDELKRVSGELDWAFRGNEWAAASTAPAIPDLILLDCMMPRLDGLSFATELSRHPTAKFVPIIAMTSKKQMEEPFRQLRNVTGFITKPPNRRQLLEAVRNLGDKPASNAGP
jgi:CheY-like chemotaxis protein